MSKGIGGHQSSLMGTDVWLTPKYIIDALGGFDLDPCAAPEPRPWPTAEKHITLPDNGLFEPWGGRVWLNPPYGKQTGRWLGMLVDHGWGMALIFARTETDMFFRYVWEEADATLFLKGRLTFCWTDGTPAKHNSGGPSVLVAYGRADARVLRDCGLAGKYIDLMCG